MRIQNSVIAPHILIKAHDQDDYNKAESALTKLASRPNGRSLIAEIGKLSTNGRAMMISVVDAYTNTTARPKLTTQQAAANGVPDSEFSLENNAIASKLAFKSGMQKGTGTSTNVDFNHKQYVAVDEAGMPFLDSNKKLSFVSLAHEMVHGYRIMKGTYTGGVGDRYTAGTPAANEEERAVGLGKYKNEAFTENSIRTEHGLPLRNQYAADRSRG